MGRVHDFGFAAVDGDEGVSSAPPGVCEAGDFRNRIEPFEAEVVYGVTGDCLGGACTLEVFALLSGVVLVSMSSRGCGVGEVIGLFAGVFGAVADGVEGGQESEDSWSVAED
ncbi:hypothetical protein DMA15_36430 [Streptomyces sp. WAC 01529]|nr:hypothetical protein DMA15_36430 [Streptomyces sp. WAC 01529]